MQIIKNPSVEELYKYANENNYKISSTGALLAYSGKNTGRCPKDKRIVYDENTKDIDWGDVNKPINKELYNFYLENAKNELESNKLVYQIDSFVGWDPIYKLKVRVLTTNPYHALFVKNMFIMTEPFDNPDFVIYDVSHKLLNEVSVLENIIRDDKLNENLVALNFTDMNMLIYGTEYAGEIKKGILTLIMYLAPKYGNLPLHSSCNKPLIENEKEGVTLFFGLSGTGKTTLSTDSSRQPIGDDEHVWTEQGVYNVEGGNYAKCINLSKENEPEIYNAIKYGSVIENAIVNKENIVDFNDSSITENTRCAYPLEYIPNALIPAMINEHPKNIIFLSCDGFGILPPISKLTPEQAEFFFVLGYTSKMPGTEVGITEPQITFSACFGGPFLVWKPTVYGKMLREKIEKHNATVWIINTGWIEKGYGIGRRIPIKYCREIIKAIHLEELKNVEFIEYPLMKIQIPTICGSIPLHILNPVSNDNIEQIKEFENKIKKFMQINY